MIVFFYSHVYEGYYENNAGRCFNYLSGYADNSTTRLSHLVFHPESEFSTFTRMANPRQHCLTVEVEDHADMGKREI